MKIELEREYCYNVNYTAERSFAALTKVKMENTRMEISDWEKRKLNIISATHNSYAGIYYTTI